MMIPQMRSPELSGNSPMARSRSRAPSLALCVIGMLTSAVACNGSIDANEDVASARPGTNTTTGTAAPMSPRQGGSTGTASAADTDPSDVRSNEGSDNVTGISDDESSASSGRRGGSGRGRDREEARDEEEDEDEDEIDAGVIDAGDVVDAGEVIDAGADIDAGLAADAAAALP
jgi:hypothetical protein